MERSSGSTRLFVDEVTIHVRGGKGGDGCIAFHREKYVPKGGPSGGDGGRGGAVYLEAVAELNTLLELAGRHHWHAEDGEMGMGSNCHGRNGRDLVVKVPAGTLVYDAETGVLLKDLSTPGQRVRVARSGRGGYGNARYASSTNQAPRYAQPGRPGEERTLRLELKLIADVGLVGMPNAGKSTLLARLTNARPKIAPYPFTTREPQLGILELSDHRCLVLADIPGLLEGAHEGKGLGDAFLRHIERTRVIVHLVDLVPPEGAATPLEAYNIIRGELDKYSPALAARREVLVGTKMDLTGAELSLHTLRQALGRPIIGISGVTGANLRQLAEALWQAVEEVRAAEPSPPDRTIDLGPDAASEGESDDVGEDPDAEPFGDRAPDAAADGAGADGGP